MVASATWTPPENRDTSYFIFKKLFMCKIKNIDSMSIDYIRIFGSPTSGDTTSDYGTTNELITRMLTINQMVEYYKQGITIHVVNYNDTKEIYDRISDHLNAWKTKLNTSFHVREAPIDDLVLLDKFASVVYQHAVRLMDTKYVDSILSRQIAGTLNVTRDNILAPLKSMSTTINPIEEDKPPERLSMASSFVSTLPSTAVTKKWR